jgi:membrane protein YdbS with pleckstrin-like domain
MRRVIALIVTVSVLSWWRKWRTIHALKAIRPLSHIVGLILRTESKQIVKVKPSLFPFTWKGVVIAFLGVLLLAGSLTFESLLMIWSASALASRASLSVIAIGALIVLVGAARRSMYSYQLTDSHIVIQKQLFGRSVRRIPFTSISDVEVSQSVVGRLVGYGNVVPVTKSGYGLVRGMDASENLVGEMTNVPNPDRVAGVIMTRASQAARAMVNQ